MTQPTPSPEVRAALREFCRIQEAKYGPDWKAKLAAEMAAKTTPVLLGLLRLGTPNGPRRGPEQPE